MTRDHVWFDRVVAGVFWLACGTEFSVYGARHGVGSVSSVAVKALLLAGIALPSLARRQEPELVAAATFTALFCLCVGFPQLLELVVPQLVLFIIPYAVAAYGRRLPPTFGFAICFVPSMLIAFVASSDHSGSWFVVAAVGSSWALGRYVRSNRELTARLRANIAQIATEREARERLVVADQRSQIARELQAVVADHVSTMTVQARAAQRLVHDGDEHADEAMATIEETGRQTMSDLRRLLGVLRRPGGDAELAPQPGVGQIAKLVERVRSEHRKVALRVEGDPAALAAVTDLGLYRIIEDVLGDVGDDAIEIALRFSEADVALQVTVARSRHDWPSVATAERVALCEGQLNVISDGETTVLTVRMPRVLDGVLS